MIFIAESTISPIAGNTLIIGIKTPSTNQTHSHPQVFLLTFSSQFHFSNNHYFDKFFFLHSIFSVYISQPIFQNIFTPKSIYPLSPIPSFPITTIKYVTFHSLYQNFISCSNSMCFNLYLWFSHFLYETISLATIKKGGNLYERQIHN